MLHSRQKREKDFVAGLTRDALRPQSSIRATFEMVFSDSPDSDDSFDDVDLAGEIPPDLEEGYLTV